MFNSASEDMFDVKKSDVIGMGLDILFFETDQAKIKTLLNKMEKSQIPFGETFEAVAMRKNKSTFPVKVALCVSFFQEKQVISCFLKDYTTEKKQNTLISEEKKKSEELLLNILPLPVANRLKNGENQISEKFNDVTVFFSDM